MPVPRSDRPRQRRGLARIDLILEAATQVVAEQGYERATTNAIAARAGISPGSLYQYFSSKQDIASALWQRYSQQLTAVLDVAGLTNPETGTAELVDRVVDPLHALKTTSRAFGELYARTGAEDLEAVNQTNAALHARLVEILSVRNPHADAVLVETATGIVRAMFSLTIAPHSLTGDPQVDVREVKRAMVAYLAAKGLR